MLKPQPFGRKSEGKSQKVKDSLERLQNQFYQAQASGNTGLMKKIKLIMDRINEQNKS